MRIQQGGRKATNLPPPPVVLSTRPKAMPFQYDIPNYKARLPPSRKLRPLGAVRSQSQPEFLPPRLPNGKRYSSRLNKSPPRRQPRQQSRAVLPAIGLPLQEMSALEEFAYDVPDYSAPPPMMAAPQAPQGYSPEMLGAWQARPHERRGAAKTEKQAREQLQRNIALYFNDMEGAFRDLDRDGSGQLDKDELLGVLAKVSGGQVGDAERALVAKMDKDGDGQVDYKEFVGSLGQVQQASAKEVEVAVTKIREHINTKYKKIGDAFRGMDEDHSGEISIAELEEGLQHLNLNIPTSHIKAVIRAFDSDQSGQISFAEFAKKLRELAEDQETSSFYVHNAGPHRWQKGGAHPGGPLPEANYHGGIDPVSQHLTNYSGPHFK